MTREAMLIGAMRYLDREGTITAADLGVFGAGDAELLDRLRNGARLQPGEFEEATPFVLTMLDRVIAKVTAERTRLADAAAVPVLRCAA